LTFKLLFALADLATAALVVRFASPEHAIWYAWNPAVIYAFAGAGHYDSLLLLALAAALLTMARARSATQESRGNWAAASCAALGLGVALKLVPFFLFRPG
jgi:hypothetical protein